MRGREIRGPHGFLSRKRAARAWRSAPRVWLPSGSSTAGRLKPLHGTRQATESPPAENIDGGAGGLGANGPSTLGSPPDLQSPRLPANAYPTDDT